MAAPEGEMMKNDVLRPACLGDVPHGRFYTHEHVDQNGNPTRHLHTSMTRAVLHENEPLRQLYDAEWQKRGFERSP